MNIKMEKMLIIWLIHMVQPFIKIIKLFRVNNYQDKSKEKQYLDKKVKLKKFKCFLSKNQKLAKIAVFLI